MVCRMYQKSLFCFVAATAFAVISVVSSKEWALDFHGEDRLNEFVNIFHSKKVSTGIFGRYHGLLN